MLGATFATQIGLKNSSRLPSLSRSTGIVTGEFACLLACGAFAAMAIGLIHLQFRVPGHAIIRGAIPIALGFALVPRRLSGTLMAIGAGVTAAAMGMSRIGVFPSTSMLSILALGPILDLALLGPSSGWKLYFRFAAAGATANLLAYALKLAGVRLNFEMVGGGGGGGQFLSYGTIALVSFLLCGVLAGLVSSAVWFRASRQ